MNDGVQLKIPFVDIFAGPGGLSEGFSRHAEFYNSDIGFESRLAIEKEPVAVETLRLRSFYRQFDAGAAPNEYYRFLRRQDSISILWNLPEWKAAQEHVWEAELGAVDEGELHKKISDRLSGAGHWVLLGGPPCQAYSLMGRSRMTGIGNALMHTSSDDEAFEELHEKHEKKTLRFETDSRHILYREYLRIVAVHQPSVFVMENVKGILSAKLPKKIIEDHKLKHQRVFDQIKEDLADPWVALADDAKFDFLASKRIGEPHKYKLFSFVQFSEEPSSIRDSDFLIRAEDYGVPQKRHRVILLGVRDDISVTPTILQKSDQATVSDAIGDLPALRSGLSRHDMNFEHWQDTIKRTYSALVGHQDQGSSLSKALVRLTHNAKEYDRGAAFIPLADTLPPRETPLSRWLTDLRLDGILQHESRTHMASDLVRYLYVSAEAEKAKTSPKLQEWPVALLPKHRNVEIDEVTGKTTTGGFDDRFKVQSWSFPSSTITSHISKDGHFFIHPDPSQCRSLTVREAARLQTFPDNYFFCGNRTQQYHQIGNAVPPFLAVQLARVVAGLISDAIDQKAQA